MQSTSVYWIAVYDILEATGFAVYLVNARDTKNPPGRKSDVQVSQWLMKLHAFGLLRNSFRSSQWPTNRKLNVRRSVDPYDFPRCQRHTN